MKYYTRYNDPSMIQNNVNMVAGDGPVGEVFPRLCGTLCGNTYALATVLY